MRWSNLLLLFPGSYLFCGPSNQTLGPLVYFTIETNVIFTVIDLMDHTGSVDQPNHPTQGRSEDGPLSVVTDNDGAIVPFTLR